MPETTLMPEEFFPFQVTVYVPLFCDLLTKVVTSFPVISYTSIFTFPSLGIEYLIFVVGLNGFG